MVEIDYELWIHRIPEHLSPPLPEHLQDTFQVWKRVVDAKVCWRVARIDAWNHIWIDVRFKNDHGEIEDHSLAMEEGCFEKVGYGGYEVEVEFKVDADTPET